MRTLEILLNRRWILKARDKELYYQIKEALSVGEEKKFLMEKLGYQVIVNPYMIKVERYRHKRKTGWGFQSFGSL